MWVAAEQHERLRCRRAALADRQRPLGFRRLAHHAIQLSLEPPRQQDNVTRGVVKEIAYMGDRSISLVQLGTGKLMRVTQPNAHRHADDITWDQQVYLHWHSSSPVVLIE